MRKKIIGLAFALILALTTYVPALAHECFIASRSDTGAVAASHSGMWYYFGDLNWLFSNFQELLGGGPTLTPSQVSWAVQQAQAAGVPNQLTVFTSTKVGGGTGVLLGNTPVDTASLSANGTPLLANGKGIDHLENYFGILVTIYQQAAAR